MPNHFHGIIHLCGRGEDSPKWANKQVQFVLADASPAKEESMQFQSYAYGKNHWSLDPDLKIILQRNWPDLARHEAELVRFGELAGGRAYQVADYVDRQAPPELVMVDLDG
jgi:hypothetical protein